MIVAFWNVNTGMGSPAWRRKTLKAWIAERKPDVLFLCEVGHSMMVNDGANLLALAPGYRLMPKWVHTTTFRFPPGETSCCLAVLVKTPSPHSFRGTTAQFPDPANRRRVVQRRLLVKLNVKLAGAAKYFPIWGIHANASPRGGDDACERAKAYLDTTAGREAVIGGDFNFPIGFAGYFAKLNAIQGLGFPVLPPGGGGVAVGPPLACTQWKSSFPGKPSKDAKKALKISEKILLDFEPHGVIDYAACWPGVPAAGGAGGVPPIRTVVPVPNCFTSKTWHDILRFFDHLPVVYDIT